MAGQAAGEAAPQLSLTVQRFDVDADTVHDLALRGGKARDLRRPTEDPADRRTHADHAQ